MFGKPSELKNFFSVKSVAVFGASRNARKVGHIILRNFVDSKFKGKIYPVNLKAKVILRQKCVKSLFEVNEEVDMAVIAIPARFVPDALEQCGKKGTRFVIIVSGGFAEIGNFELDSRIREITEKYKIQVIGPNCLGIFDAYTDFDTLFFPRYRLGRPDEGGISFISQSGAVGAAVIDLASREGYGFSKFISYGNALNVDETDLLEYLGSDKNTKVICMYIEGIKDGRRFMKVAEKVVKKKPVVVLKAGTTKASAKAVSSHTGSLAGSPEVYSAAFHQSGVIEATCLEDLFNFARTLESQPAPKGKRVQIITNGGGYGILSADACMKYGLELAQMKAETIEEIKKQVPDYAVVSNPLDLIGDADTQRYKIAIEGAMNDSNVDMIFVIILYQSPLVTPDIVDVITEAYDEMKKPIVAISTGGDFTEVHSTALQANGVTTFTYVKNAARALKMLFEHYRKR
ncbi:MAG: CoA-binding protein [Candidatus Diapherotrites archaeon]|nr:CoA-binding protein [Candidatus Diapherotrites archaeon]